MTAEALALIEESHEVINLEFGYALADLVTALRRAHVVISIYASITAEMVAEAPELQAIMTFGVGYDHLDVEAITQRGITIHNTRGANAEAVAELAVCLMLNLARRTCRASKLLKEGGWRRGEAFPPWLSGTELWEKTLGLIGLGNIGQRVARMAHGFDMRILAFDPFVTKEFATGLGAELTDLDRVFQESDFVTLHVPLSAETAGLVNRERLRSMKPTAYLINTCRGPVIDEGALVEALEQGWIAGAGLDVFEEEPLPLEHPLLELDTVILTPHIGGFSEETLRTASMDVAKRVLQALAGEVPDNLVNQEALLDNARQSTERR
jgi:D-3-phosphoglycerate dehydrogenase